MTRSEDESHTVGNGVAGSGRRSGGFGGFVTAAALLATLLYGWIALSQQASSGSVAVSPRPLSARFFWNS